MTYDYQVYLLTDREEVGWSVVEVVGPGEAVLAGHHLGGAAALGGGGDDGHGYQEN